MTHRPEHRNRGRTTTALLAGAVLLLTVTALLGARPLLAVREAHAADADIEITVTAPREPPDGYVVPPPAGFVGILAANPVRQPVNPDPAYGTSLALDSNAAELINRGLILGPRAPGCYRTVVSREIRVKPLDPAAVNDFLQDRARDLGLPALAEAEQNDPQGIVIGRHTVTVEWKTDGTAVTAGQAFPRVETNNASSLFGVTFTPPSSVTSANTLPQPTLTSESTTNITVPLLTSATAGVPRQSTITIRDSAVLTDFAPNVNAPDPAHGVVASRPC